VTLRCVNLRALQRFGLLHTRLHILALIIVAERLARVVMIEGARCRGEDAFVTITGRTGTAHDPGSAVVINQSIKMNLLESYSVRIRNVIPDQLFRFDGVTQIWKKTSI
jgi:hypothetical protein